MVIKICHTYQGFPYRRWDGWNPPKPSKKIAYSLLLNQANFDLTQCFQYLWEKADKCDRFV